MSQPQAYLNWVLVDEQYGYVPEGSGYVQASSSTGLQTLATGEIEVVKSGYLTVFVSNQSSSYKAYFDNLSIEHRTGPLLAEDDYYPFGLTMAGISSKAAGKLDNKLKFGGKELNRQEFSDGSGLDLYDFSARNYDPQMGRFWSGDPKADKLVFASPYSYCLNNPIIFLDPDGKFPYPIHVRSFAPFVTFGGGFHGDNRGYSTALGKQEPGGSVTSRVQQTFTVDPSKGAHTAPVTWSDPSSHAIFSGNKTATPTGSITDFKSSTDKNGNSTVSFTSTYAGSLPLIPHSPDIDVKTSFTMVENASAGTLSVTAHQKGDAFPTAETLIGDTKGNQLFVGVAPATASGATGPMDRLPGDNDRGMMYNSFVITIDKDGVFTGVKQGDRVYTIADWNKTMQDKPLVTKPYPPR